MRTDVFLKRLGLGARLVVACVLGWNQLPALVARGDAQLAAPVSGPAADVAHPFVGTGPGSPGQLTFPAHALNFDSTGTIITEYETGLRWQANYAATAYLNVPRPVTWTGTGFVEFVVYFYGTSAVVGDVDFFIRPRAFSSGETFADGPGLNTTAAHIASQNQLQSQTFTIPASTFGSKDLWVISMQRGGSSETYAGDVVLTSVELRFASRRQPVGQIPLNSGALNFKWDGVVITRNAPGLRWQQTYSEATAIVMPRPIDWDGVSSVEVRLYFEPLTAESGNVDFFLRVKPYNMGDEYIAGGGSAFDGTPVPAAGIRKVQIQAFTIPAALFEDKERWEITMQREGSAETYPGDVILFAVDVRYGATDIVAGRLTYAANAINHRSDVSLVYSELGGVSWPPTHLANGYLTVARPKDWDGVSPVELRLYMQSRLRSLGDVDFFIRPRAFDPGDTFADASSLSGTPVAVTGTLRELVQSFSIPANRLNNGQIWFITLQRNGPGETYTDDIVLHCVELRYTALRNVYLPLLRHD